MNEILGNFRPAQHVLCAGDFNIDTLAENSISHSYLDIFLNRGMIPFISLPTRVSDTSSTLLDHIWSNVYSGVPGIFHTSITDHFTIFVNLVGLKSRNSDFFKIKFRDHSERALQQCYERFFVESRNLSRFDTLSIDTRTKLFLNTLWKSYNESCQIRAKFISYNTLKKTVV